MNGDSAWLGDIGGAGVGEWSMGDLEGGAGFWGGGGSALPDLTDAEIRALRDSGLTTDTSAQYGSGSSWDWGGIFKSTLGAVAGAVGSTAGAYFNRTSPPQLGYGVNAPGGSYRFSLPGVSVGGAPGILGGASSLLSNPLVLLAIIGGFVLLMVMGRR
jgi:hypothetical protein